MIHCKHPDEVGVYIDLKSDGLWDEEVWFQRKSQIKEEGDLEENWRNFVAECEAAATEALLKEISLRLSPEVRALLRQEEEAGRSHPLLVVIDEVGLMPHLVGTLGTIRENLTKRIQEELQLKLDCNFMAGGRGANTALFSLDHFSLGRFEMINM